MKAFIFDLFNTLVTDTDSIGRDSKAFPEIPFQKMRDFRNVNDFGSREAAVDPIARHFGITLTPQRKAFIIRHYEAWSARQKPLPDAERLLAQLKKKCKVALISNAGNLIDDVLERLGMGGFFDVIIFSNKVGLKKPDSRIYRLCIERLGVKAEDCCMVGDNLELDFLMPRQLGMRAVLFDPGNRHPGVSPRVARLRDLLIIE
ncbi:MAG: HAD family hydrolase [Nanoarchaeota archaeon]